ncbi:hypothetical protein [Megamonas funiformis]|uniref:hypothetical protein n=1 Tax=Megamonas funiformis TaxID=437897 RepID=UPI003994ACA8
MNKKISQFELTTKLQEQDLITLVQDGSNKNITSGSFTTSLSGTFATNERVDAVEEDVEILDTKVNDNYKDLSNKIVEGDTSVTTNLNSAITSYYDVLNNKIITLDTKHDTDMSEIGGTMQEWIDDIDNRSTLQQLQDALSRLTVAENTITALAEVIANGGGSGSTPGYHTQSTATIFPLSGYYKANDASPLATSDTLNQALSKLENQVEAVASSSGSLPVIKSTETTQPSDGTLYTSLKTEKTFLNKYGDTAEGRIDFKNGLQGGTIFRSGWDGQGASLYPFGTKWNLELDNLFVRGNMTVNELTVNEIKAVGGDLLVTLGDMKCTKVETLADGYKCYFDTEDGTKYNEFVVNDMAICQQFGGKNVKRYWRKVNEVGRDYIVLSKDVCEPNSSEPGEGDTILQLGHMYEADPDYNLQMDERRNAIYISAKGINSPRLTFYKGIDEFTLADDPVAGVVRERVVIGGEQTKFVGTIYQTSDTGIVRVPVYKGPWVSGNTYYYYDQVSHNGSLWICMKPDGTTAEPKDEEDDWQKQVSKGEAGTPSDDVAKWVEITGERLFLYETPDDSGTPTPSTISLMANVHGMTNPSFKWTRLDTGVIMGTYSSLEVFYTSLNKGQRTLSLRCTVTNSDGGEYYDDVQLAKLFNGAEGADAYYVDLSNGTAVIPYDESGNPKIIINEIYTDVVAYHGINPIAIKNMTVRTSKGSATSHVGASLDRIYLDTLNSTTAEITISVTLEDGYTIDKVWYIGSTKDGENGFNGEDAMYLTMTGEQYFHYKSGETVPNPTYIDISTSTTNVNGATYKWYYSEAGKYSWNLIQNEVGPTLRVQYNSAWMNIADEVTFKCVVTDSVGNEFYDFITINKVRDGENVYRGSLQNENCSIVTDENGNFTADAARVATTTSKLRYGNEEVTNYTLQGYGTPYYGTGPSLSYNSSTKELSYPTDKLSSFTSDALVYRIDFYTTVKGANTKVDTVDFVISKSKQGITGQDGKQEVTIYICSNSTPSRPTFATLPTATGAYNWSLDAHYLSSYTTWSSKGTYNPNTNSIDLIPDTSYRWTEPVKFSGKDGVNGADGRNAYSPYVGSDGFWYYWDDTSQKYVQGRYAKGDTGPSGPAGPALTFRGDFSSSKTYYWTDDRRDVVKHNGQYYIVKSKGSTNKLDGFKVMSSFEMVATGLLLAQTANIAGWNFDPTGIIYSANKKVVLNPGNDAAADNPVFAIGIDDIVTNKGDKHTGSLLQMYAGGILTVGPRTINGNAASAGMAGNGKWRFWAGTNYGNAGNAPFRVDGDGNMYATSGTFTGSVNCKSLNVSSNYLSNWNGPGTLFCIYHVGRTKYNLVNIGGNAISNVTTSGGGYVFSHNFGTSQVSALHIGSMRGGDSAGFAGSAVINEVTSTTVKITFIDTKGNTHVLDSSAAADIYFFRMK